MIEQIVADVRPYQEGVTNPKEKARLTINIYGDDEDELKYSMMRMIQAIYRPIPPLIRMKEAK